MNTCQNFFPILDDVVSSLREICKISSTYFKGPQLCLTLQPHTVQGLRGIYVILKKKYCSDFYGVFVVILCKHIFKSVSD